MARSASENSEGASKYFEIRRAVEVIIKSEKRSQCKTVLRELDDETYVKDGVPTFATKNAR